MIDSSSLTRREPWDPAESQQSWDTDASQSANLDRGQSYQSTTNNIPRTVWTILQSVSEHNLDHGETRDRTVIPLDLLRPDVDGMDLDILHESSLQHVNCLHSLRNGLAPPPHHDLPNPVIEKSHASHDIVHYRLLPDPDNIRLLFHPILETVSNLYSNVRHGEPVKECEWAYLQD